MSLFSKIAKGVSKTVKKVAHSVAKPLRKVVAAQAGFATLGLVKPKALGITSKSNQRLYRVSGNVGKAAAAVTAGVIAAPAIGAGLPSLEGLGAAAGGMVGKVKDSFSKIPFFGGNSKPDNSEQIANQVDGPGARFGNLFSAGMFPYTLLFLGGGAILLIYFFRRK